MADINALGQRYESIAVAFPFNGYGILSPAGVAHFEEVLAAMSRRRIAGSDMSSVSRMLRRVRGILYHSARIREFSEKLPDLPGAAPGDFIAWAPVELAIEIESFLFQSAAALDTLSGTCSAQIAGFKLPKPQGGGKARVYFSNLKKGLINAVATDHRATALIDLIDECESQLRETILSDGTKITVRNYLAHKGGLPDLTTSELALHILPDGKALRLDSDIGDLPLIGTVRSLSGTLPYLLGRAATVLLSTALGSQQLADRSLFNPSWNSTLINWRDFEGDENDPSYSRVKFSSSGFTIDSVRLRPEVLRRAIEFPPPGDTTRVAG